MIPLRDDIPSRTRPFVAWLIIAANAAVFWHELKLGRSIVPFIDTWGLVPAHYTVAGYLHRLPWDRIVGPFFTSMFLHGGWFHIISNMWVLYIFGDNVEDRLGHGRFLLFYLLCGLAAGAVQVWASPRSILPTVGASGAIAGVMGAYFILFPHARVTTLVPIFIFIRLIELPASIFLGVWILSQVFATRGGAVAGIAWWAHIGGFVAGVVLLGPFLARTSRSRR